MFYRRLIFILITDNIFINNIIINNIFYTQVFQFFYKRWGICEEPQKSLSAHWDMYLVTS